MRLLIVTVLLAGLACATQSSRNELCDAAWRGDRAAVERLLHDGAALEHEYQAQTPLMWAAKMGHLEIVGHLLAAGADVNHRTKDGWTALAFASWSGKTAIARMLLERGARVGPGPYGHGNELHLASERGTAELVELLLPAVEDVDATVALRQGRTALLIAAEHGSTDVARRLLAAGASPAKRTEDGNTAAHFAAIYGRREILDELLARAPELVSDTGNPLGRSPLALAAQFGHAELVGALVDANWKSSALRLAEDRYGWTPLHLAATSGSRDVARPLMWTDALEVRTDLGRTPLHLAALAKDGPMMELLLERGAKPDARDRWGLTPLELWREAGALERVLVGAGPASAAPAPAFDAKSASPLQLRVESFGGGFFRHDFALVVWADGVVLFDAPLGSRTVERRIGRIAPERLERLLAELAESGLFDGPPVRHGHPDSSELLFTRVVDGQAVERRWDGIDQSLSSEIDAEFRMFLRAFERARAAALSAVPSEAWSLAVVAPDGKFRGIER